MMLLSILTTDALVLKHSLSAFTILTQIPLVLGQYQLYGISRPKQNVQCVDNIFKAIFKVKNHWGLYDNFTNVFIPEGVQSTLGPLIARFMGPTWGPSGADRTQVGPMLAPWTFLSGSALVQGTNRYLKQCWPCSIMLYDITRSQWVTLNTLRLRQNGCHLADDIFKCIFLNENVWISIKISLNFVPEGRINNILALVQIMAWRRQGDKPLSEPLMVSLLMQICVTLASMG